MTSLLFFACSAIWSVKTLFLLVAADYPGSERTLTLAVVCIVAAHVTRRAAQ